MGIIYEPRGKAREYAKLAANLYAGCDHGCDYCFGPQALRKNKKDFHAYNKPKKDALTRLAKDAEKLGKAGEDREILLSFITDPYQTIESEENITRQAIEILIKNNLRFTVLTKGGIRAARDFDLLRKYKKASFGSTICFTKQDDADKWEPNAPTIDMRIAAIKAAHSMGIKTWISLEPVIDTEQALKLIQTLHPVVDHWKIGKINYHPEIESKVDWIKFREDVKLLFKSLDITNYYLKKSLTGLENSENSAREGRSDKSIVVSADIVSSEVESPWTEGDISIRKGKCNVLLIAPHGHPKDDTNTYELTRKIADKLDCYAVVNKKYQKPKSASLQNPNVRKFAVDLNRWGQINLYSKIKKQFLDPINPTTQLRLVLS